jgi:hypothetical protein
VWWDADNNGLVQWDAITAELERFADPRWQGAVSHTDGSATAEDVDFRALRDAGSLYLSWQVKTDPGGLNKGNPDYKVDGDAVVFGIKEPSGRVVMFWLILNTDISTPLDAAQGLHVLTRKKDAGQAWADVSPPPSWATGTARVWTRVVDVTTGEVWWAFQMKIPMTPNPDPTLNSGLNLGDPFLMWYTYVVFSKSATVNQYHWPRPRPNIDFSNGSGVPNPDLSTNWGQFSLGPSASSCAGDVSLASTQVGTTNVPDSKIGFTNPSLGPNTFWNTFFARPRNLHASGGSAINSGSITATFYIANWGSQVGDIAASYPNVWYQISPPTSPANANAIPANDVAHGDPMRNDIQFQYKVDDCERYDYLSGSSPPSGCPPKTARTTDQCILVELTSGDQLVFLNKSVRRNMNFGIASKLQRDAELSIVGLSELPGSANRDVYLYVETRNMPKRTYSNTLRRDTIVPASDTSFVSPRDTLVRPGLSPASIPGPAKVLIPGRDSIVVPSIGRGERGELLRTAAADGLLNSDQIDQLMPTYRVHVYHATGDSMTVSGVKHPVLNVQSSFGYWVDHRGDIQGWRHRIEGANLIRLAPNFYRIAVPNNGVAKVTTTIEALEPKRFALSFHGGVSLPHRAFANVVDPGFGVTADFEFRLNHTFTFEGLFGFHRFPGIAPRPDVDLTHISGGLKAFLTPGPTRLFVSAGGGRYTFDPGATDPGAHAGAGVQFNPSLGIALEVMYTAHTVFTSSSNTTFSSIQAGGRVRF